MVFRTFLKPLVVTLGAFSLLTFLSTAADEKKDDKKKEEDKTEVYVVTMETSHGDVELELDRVKAKETVDNFLKYVRDGYYEKTLFHRVEKGYIVQGGGFVKNKDGEYVRKDTGKREAVKSQADNGLKNVKGAIAAARWADNKDSAKSGFFINLAENKALDAPMLSGSGFTVFGKVTKGMEVVEKIGNLEVQTKGTLRLGKKKDDESDHNDYEVPFLPQEDVVLKKITATAKK
ncbi:MAG: peptidyl-prolyl cis-trans isomerase A (cyclophilin A) [Verrucomicrobiales bacterium]|jgi:peptidyl-prolyl cis-trans isomerase A (cyclophilin A)